MIRTWLFLVGTESVQQRCNEKLKIVDDNPTEQYDQNFSAMYMYLKHRKAWTINCCAALRMFSYLDELGPLVCIPFSDSNAIISPLSVLSDGFRNMPRIQRIMFLLDRDCVNRNFVACVRHKD